MIAYLWNVHKRQIYSDRKDISGCLTWELGEMEWLLMGTGFLFWDDENILKLTVAMIAQLWIY